MVAFINALLLHWIHHCICISRSRLSLPLLSRILIKHNTMCAVWQFDIIIIYFESRSLTLNYIMRERFCMIARTSIFHSWCSDFCAQIYECVGCLVRAFFCVDAKFHSITITRNKLGVKRVQEKYIMNFPRIHINLER